MLPAMKTTTTNASHPQMAFLRCRPLQAAMRAARLCFEDEVDMTAPDGLRSAPTLRKTPCTVRVLEPETTSLAEGWGDSTHRPYTHAAKRERTSAAGLTRLDSTGLER